MSAVRKHSATTVPIRRLGDLSPLEKDLERCQLWSLVAWYASRNQTDRDVELYERLARKDVASELMGSETEQFKNAVEQIMRKILLRSTTRIVATTLGASANDILRLGFSPDTLVCDESGQCLEAEHVTAMTMTSLKAVILIGDPDQLPPTVISAGQTNEYARYLQRPLMSRLRDADYPLERLNVNYRCHTSILEFFNRTIYCGTLIAGPRNDEVKRAGSVWDEFTATRAAFRTQNVNGRRQLFVDVSAVAHQEGTSFCNRGQVEVLKEFLSGLYGFKTQEGASIVPSDVLIICPYRAQRDLVKETLEKNRAGYKDNLTVDASQGQEAPVVFFLLTKPEANPNKLGFVAD